MSWQCSEYTISSVDVTADYETFYTGGLEGPWSASAGTLEANPSADTVLFTLALLTGASLTSLPIAVTTDFAVGAVTDWTLTENGIESQIQIALQCQSTEVNSSSDNPTFWEEWWDRKEYAIGAIILAVLLTLGCCIRCFCRNPKEKLIRKIKTELQVIKDEDNDIIEENRSSVLSDLRKELRVFALKNDDNIGFPKFESKAFVLDMQAIAFDHFCKLNRETALRRLRDENPEVGPRIMQMEEDQRNQYVENELQQMWHDMDHASRKRFEPDEDEIEDMRKQFDVDSRDVDVRWEILPEIIKVELKVRDLGIPAMFLILDEIAVQPRNGNLWSALLYVAQQMWPYYFPLRVLHDNIDKLLLVDQEMLSAFCQILVKRSSNPLATALQVAGIFQKLSDTGFTSKVKYEGVVSKNTGFAVDIVDAVQTDIQLAVMLEAKGPAGGKSPIQTAMSNRLLTFLYETRISRIMHRIWTHGLFYSSFRNATIKQRDANFSMPEGTMLAQARIAFLRSPEKFYFCPFGKFCLEGLFFLVYVVLATALTLNGFDMTQRKWEVIEWWIWMGNIGYMIHHTINFHTKGFQTYLTEWLNFLDFLTSICLLGAFLQRLSFHEGYCWWEAESTKDCDSTWNPFIFNIMWGLGLILLWIRLSHLVLSRNEGPLLLTNHLTHVAKRLGPDLINTLLIEVVLFFAFMCSVYYVADESYSEFETMSDTFSTMIQLFSGEVLWSDLDDTSGSEISEERAFVCELLLWFWFALAVLALTNFGIILLTYFLQMQQTQVELTENYWRMETILFYDKRPSILPPPMNIIVVPFVILWWIFSSILVLLTGRYIDFAPFWDVNEGSKFMRLKKGNQYSFERHCCSSRSGTNHCDTMMNAFKEMTGKMAPEQDRWVCSFCKTTVGNSIDSVEALPLSDEDREALRGLYRDEGDSEGKIPTFCPYCFRAKRELSVPSMVFETLSYGVYKILVIPIYGFVYFWHVCATQSLKKPWTYYRDQSKSIIDMQIRFQTYRGKTVVMGFDEDKVHIRKESRMWRTLDKKRSQLKRHTASVEMQKQVFVTNMGGPVGYDEETISEDEERSLDAVDQNKRLVEYGWKDYEPGVQDDPSGFQPGAIGIYSTQRPIDWNRDDVVSWLQDIGMENYTSNFYENHITGQTLQDLKERELEEDLDIRSPQHRSVLMIKIRNLDFN